MTDNVPDETTLCNFRHLLEEYGLNKLFFEAINRVMVESGHIMKFYSNFNGILSKAVEIFAPLHRLICPAVKLSKKL